jgi:DNA repair exonuclease SbcCD nuclease subunit
MQREEDRNMIVCIGDLHLSDSRPWSWEVSNKIVDFIIKHPLNSPDNTAILLGDVTEDAFLSGQVFDLMAKLFSSLKFKHTYVLVGNHDLKKNKQGQLTLSFEFLKRKLFRFDTITVINEDYDFTIDGVKVLALPWKPVDMKKEYESFPDVGNTYDLLVGHFQDKSINIPGETIDIDYINAKFICLGHIHDKDHPRYIGSIIPNSIDGAGLPRYFRTYEKDKETLIPIPHIMDYCSVNFPDPLPKVDVDIPVWTVYNCKDEATAKAHYGDIYIRKAVYDVSMDKEAMKRLGQSMSNKIANKDIKEMFTEWKKGATYEPSILKLAEKYLELTK